MIRPGGTSKSVNEKLTTQSQCTHILSFISLQHKRKLFKCLAQRTEIICSNHTLEEEIRRIYNLLSKHEYLS